MDCVEENKSFITLLTTAHKRQYRQLISTATKKQLDTICGVIKNVIKGRIDIPKDILNAASSFKKILEKIAKKCFKSSRRKLFLKYGHIITRILSAALPVIIEACNVTLQAVSN
jgi:hypothetical protein